MMNDVPRLGAARNGAQHCRSSELAWKTDDTGRQETNEIDWSAVAPSWASIFTGAILPALALIVLITFVDIALCWLFFRVINPFWSGATLMVAMMMLPLALISLFFCGKLFSYLSSILGSRRDAGA